MNNATKETLQAEIIKKDGIIFSDGTLNMQHLLPKAYDLINAYNLDESGKYAGEIEALFVGESPTFSNQFYGQTKLNEAKEVEAAELYCELDSFFNSIAPEGFYFGSTEGDGACIGFFRFGDDAEPAVL